MAVDGAFAFEDYLKFNETLTFSAEAKAILDAESYDDLLELIQTHIDELEAKAKTYIHIPRKKWNIQRYIGLGLIVLLVPALIYSMYALFFAQPKLAKGEKAKEAEAAGADFVGDTDYINKIQQGWFDFDVIVATPDMMGEVGKIGRVLDQKV